MSIADKLSELASDLPRIFAAGEKSAENACSKKYLVKEIEGDGSTSLSFCVPFEPDLLLVSCFDAENLTTADAVGMFLYDSLASGTLRAYSILSTGGGYKLYMHNASSVALKYTRDDEGMTTIQNFTTSTGGSGFFPIGQKYVVTAVKYSADTCVEEGSSTFSLRRPPAEDVEVDGEWETEGLS